MTLLVLLACAVGLTAFPSLAYAWERRMHPAEWTRLNLVAVASGAFLTEIALLLCAAPIVFSGLGLEPIGIVGRAHMLPGGTAAGWISLGLAAGGFVRGVVAVRRGVGLWRRAGALIASGGARVLSGHPDVHVVASDEPLAMAIRRRGGFVVVSDGLVRLLDDAHLDAVIRHERAHLAGGHHRYLMAVSVLRGCLGKLPWVSNSLDVVALGVERWADEDAVRGPEDRRTIARALLRLTAPTAAPGLAGFSAPRMIAERIRALQHPAPSPSGLVRPMLYLAVTVLVLPDVLSLLAWAT